MSFQGQGHFISALLLAFAMMSSATISESIGYHVTRKVSNFSPKDFGDFHTEVFQKFGEVQSRKKRRDTKHLREDFLRVMSSYCDEDDGPCLASLVWAREFVERRIERNDLMSTLFSTNRQRIEAEFPTFMASELRSHLESIFSLLDRLDEHNLDEIVDAVVEIKARIEDTRTVFQAHKKMALSAAFVAIESTKLWHAVFFDRSHPLHGFLESIAVDGRRRLLRHEDDDDYMFFATCSNRLSILIGADVLGVVITPVSFFVGTPAAYVTWYLYAPYFLYRNIIGDAATHDTLYDLILNIVRYYTLPLVIPFTAIGLPTTYLSYIAFEFVANDCPAHPPPTPSPSRGVVRPPTSSPVDFAPTSAPTRGVVDPPTPLPSPSPTLSPVAWTQVGPDVFGPAGEITGTAVALTDDGGLLGVGGDAFFAVHLYDAAADDWTNVLTRTTTREVRSLSFASSAGRLAVGDEGADGSAGAVRLFARNADGTAWSADASDASALVGDAANDLFGRAVSLTDDGGRVAVGASGGDYCRVFDLGDDGVWRATATFRSDEAGSEHGASASVASGNGSKLIVGAPFGTSADGATRSGYVQFVDLATLAVMGDVVRGDFAGGRLGASVSASADGTRAAAGEPGRNQARLFELRGAAYSQLGDTLIGSDDYGFSVSMSGDGGRVAIGAYQSFLGNLATGSTCLYAVLDDGWTQIGTIFGDNFLDWAGYAVAFSGDGSRVAIGNLKYDSRGEIDNGMVNVYTSDP